MPRTKKKKSRQYFTESTERAIIRYNNSDNEILRNKIYQEHIEYPFQKLAENIIHTFKFYYFDVPSEDVKHEVVSFLVMNMHKFKAGKGKAFSYFSIVAKNYLILHNNNNYKKMKQHEKLDVLDFKRSLSSESSQVENAEANSEFTELMLNYWDNNLNNVFKRKKDIRVADSVLELFRRRQNIENFNKKALYILIREMTGSNTQHITRVINVMKKYISEMQKEFFTTGDLNTVNTGSIF
jgi:hypothetical protein|tara:strand:+ start:1557 stop:2273 length:717 start_codon:yes stop_codon:yes gene_type:complete